MILHFDHIYIVMFTATFLRVRLVDLKYYKKYDSGTSLRKCLYKHISYLEALGSQILLYKIILHIAKNVLCQLCQPFL